RCPSCCSDWRTAGGGTWCTGRSARGIRCRTLLLEPFRRGALDKGAAGEEGEDEDGAGGGRAGGHEEGPGGVAGARLVELEGQGEGELVLVGEEDEGREEVVPDVDEVEESDDGERGAREGEDDAPEDAPMRAAVDAGGFVEVAGDAQEKLAQQED